MRNITVIIGVAAILGCVGTAMAESRLNSNTYTCTGTVRSLRDNRELARTETFTVTFDAKKLVVHTRGGDMPYDVSQVSREAVYVLYDQIEKMGGKEYSVGQTGHLKSEGSDRASLYLSQVAFSNDHADARTFTISGKCIENNGR